MAQGEHVLKLGVPQIFGDFQVTLVEVIPVPKAGKKSLILYTSSYSR